MFYANTVLLWFSFPGRGKQRENLIIIRHNTSGIMLHTELWYGLCEEVRFVHCSNVNKMKFMELGYDRKLNI